MRKKLDNNKVESSSSHPKWKASKRNEDTNSKSKDCESLWKEILLREFNFKLSNLKGCLH